MKKKGSSTRRLLSAKLISKYQPKADPYNEGKMTVGVKVLVYDQALEAGEIETFINFDADDTELDSLFPGRSYWVFKEWSAKKKNKETGREGDWVYRYVNTEALETATARDATRHVAQHRETTERSMLTVEPIRAAVNAIQWLNKEIATTKKAPIEDLIGRYQGEGLINPSSGVKIGDGVRDALDLLIRFGKIFAEITPPLDQGK